MVKKSYIHPTMIVVKLQHQSIICESVRSVSSGDTGITLGGNDASYVEGGGEIRTKESSGVWDEEW